MATFDKRPGFPRTEDFYGVRSKSVSIVVILTQAEYDAIPTKDPNTLYFIKE